jgi:hypothetical protein
MGVVADALGGGATHLGVDQACVVLDRTNVPVGDRTTAAILGVHGGRRY